MHLWIKKCGPRHSRFCKRSKGAASVQFQSCMATRAAACLLFFSVCADTLTTNVYVITYVRLIFIDNLYPTWITGGKYLSGTKISLYMHVHEIYHIGVNLHYFLQRTIRFYGPIMNVVEASLYIKHVLFLISNT